MWARMVIQTAPLRLTGVLDEEVRDFLRTCQRVIPRYSMVSVDRLESLYRLSRDLASRRIPGAIVECGCWNGGAAALMARASIRGGLSRDVWLFDSFEGLPAPTADDPPEVHRAYKPGWCKGNPELAREVLLAEGVSPESVRIVKGWFEQTFPRADVGPIALLHVDSDWFQSVHQCLETFFDEVSSGGIIVFDDYQLWGGCKKAVDRFLSARGIAAELQPSGRNAVFLIKR